MNLALTLSQPDILDLRDSTPVTISLGLYSQHNIRESASISITLRLYSLLTQNGNDKYRTVRIEVYTES